MEDIYPTHPDNINFSKENANSRKTTKEYLTHRLEESDISVERGVSLQPGTKCPAKGTKWRNVELPPIKDVDSDYGVRTGDGLVVIDVDTWGDMPDPLQEFIGENPTLTIKSPHSDERDGHYYFATDSEINRNPSGCDLQGEGAYAVGPGSRLTDCEDGCCTKEDPGVYGVKEDRPIAHVPTDEIESVVPTSDKSPTETNECSQVAKVEVPDYDPSIAQYAESGFDEIKEHSTAFFFDLYDRLRGGTGDMGDTLLDDGEINTSNQDTLTIQHLYGFFHDTEGIHPSAQ
jgi:hypothetical protein